jgi:DNA polymerase
MLVGEQPGDQEDRQGAPFVGPAGRLLNEALQAAGIDREKAYVTNAVKHFRWEPRGKRRIHRPPSLEQVRACRPWLEDELRLASPRALVLMGAVAARALLGRGFKVSEQRGRVLDSHLARLVIATVHPSSILRQSDPTSRAAEFERFVADLALAAHRAPAH